MKTKSRIEIELEQDFNEFKRSLEQDITEPDLADRLKAELDKIFPTVLIEEDESESSTEVVLTPEEIAELQGFFD